jgi:hypothetical protein
MKVICINAKGLPNEIPLSKRIKEGEIYTVIRTIKCNSQNGSIAFVLEEIQLGADEQPYQGFSAHRFVIDLNSILINRMPETREVQMPDLVEA